MVIWDNRCRGSFSIWHAMFNNLIILTLLVDILQFSHLLVQAGVVVAYVPIVFLTQRYWVFHNNSAGSFE